MAKKNDMKERNLWLIKLPKLMSNYELYTMQSQKRGYVVFIFAPGPHRFYIIVQNADIFNRPSHGKWESEKTFFLSIPKQF